MTSDIEGESIHCTHYHVNHVTYNKTHFITTTDSLNMISQMYIICLTKHCFEVYAICNMAMCHNN